MAAVAEVDKRLLARRSAGPRPGLTVESVSWACEGRHKAGTYGEYVGLGGRGLARHLRLGTCYESRHQVGEACCRRGGVAGAEPPHKGGPNRPDRPNCSGQWLVVSCQRLRMVCLRVDRGRERASLLAEVQESSPQFWDTIRPISLANFGLIGYTKWWQKPCLSESRAHAFSPIGEADDRPKRALRRERKSTSKLREGTPRLMMAEAKTQDDIVAGERE